MFKFFAALFLIVSCWGIGKSRHARLQLRAKRLLHILDGLLCMEGEIRALCTPLPLVFSHAGRHDPLFASAARYCEETDGETAFLSALEKEGFEKEEDEILSAFAKGLAAADSTGQLQNISVTRMRLEALSAAAKEKADRLGKLYAGSGMMTGALLVIILF